MTTYNLQGTVIQFTEAGVATGVTTSTLTFTVEDGTAASFGYDLGVEVPDNLPYVYLDTDGTHRIQVESPLDTGGWWRLDRYPGLYLDYEIGTVFWGGSNATQVFRITDSQNHRVHIFALGGDPLPPLTSIAQFQSFDAQATGAATTSTTTGLGPGQTIALDTLPGITSTEDDHFFFGNDFTTPFDAGAGNDLIEIWGDSSDVAGGTGTDTLRIFGYNFYEFSAQAITGGIQLTNTWADHIIRDDVELIEFGAFESYTYNELRALIPGIPQLLEGDAGDNVLIGGNGIDTLRGFDGNDSLSGARFGDLIEGGTGDDRLDGGSGSDTIHSGTGADLILGGDDIDYIYLTPTGTHGAGPVAYNISSATQVGTHQYLSLEGLGKMTAVVDGGVGGGDQLIMGDTSDAFFLHDAVSGFHHDVALATDTAGDMSTARVLNIEFIQAGGGDDLLDLTSADYSLAGLDLQVSAGSGNDVVWGSDADEYISGSYGNDTIFSGSGSDRIRGGDGADEFQFTRTSTDVLITDFDGAEGDTLVFFNTGGATFDAGSLSMTTLGFTLDYLDAASGQTETLTVRLAQYDYMMISDLAEVQAALTIV